MIDVLYGLGLDSEFRQVLPMRVDTNNPLKILWQKSLYSLSSWEMAGVSSDCHF
jgi:hypothetical protein